MQFICDIQTPGGWTNTACIHRAICGQAQGWGRKSSGLQGMDRTGTDRVRAGVRQPYSDPRIALLTNIWAAEHLPECWLSKVGEAGSGLDAALLLLLTLKRAANSECLGLLPTSTETERTQAGHLGPQRMKKASGKREAHSG